jgi:hypothetical protein
MSLKAKEPIRIQCSKFFCGVYCKIFYVEVNVNREFVEVGG